jgi:hypothetical protein
MSTERMGRSTAVIYLNFQTNMLTNLIKDIPTIYVSKVLVQSHGIMMKVSVHFMQQSYPFHWNDVEVSY